MNIQCAICTECLLYTQKICSTICGHMFHMECLNKWAEVSGGTCPECRTYFKGVVACPKWCNALKELTIFQLYPNISDENDEEETVELVKSKLVLSEKNYEVLKPVLDAKIAQLTYEVEAQKYLLNELKMEKFQKEEEIIKLRETLRILKESYKEKDKEIAEAKKQIAKLERYQAQLKAGENVESSSVESDEEENDEEDTIYISNNLALVKGIHRILEREYNEATEMLQQYANTRALAAVTVRLKSEGEVLRQKLINSERKLEWRALELESLKFTITDLQRRHALERRYRAANIL